ncbi:conserved protein, unknown function [Plasmodium ovale curtisi]|uniref:LRAT domain-containing protein n=1 Tax=Plasmodium ovale curtisi TaxID=864141 RepID=A0A1A8WN46_PLAOA|nr:conserved protein, unknown function [Plasmodium ovale curtisi]SBS93277.1 conserved protein, unknown function [Plasmodium ovale curtisi]
MPNDFMKNTEISKTDNKFPYCVVFAYLPCASTFIPVVGHVGICTSTGVIHDFSGSYTISVGNAAERHDHSPLCVYLCHEKRNRNMEFSDPMKYWKLDKNKLPLAITDQFYDDAIYKADEVFSKRRHNLLLNNCHHHVAMVLNSIKYKGKSDWTPFKVFLNLVIHGRFVS